MPSSMGFSDRVRQAARDETGGRCALLCNNVLPLQVLPGGQPAVTTHDASHILDDADGGASHLWNALYLCHPCNDRRRRRSSAQFPYGVAVPEQISLAWYASGYSAVAAKVMLYTIVDAAADERMQPQEKAELCVARALRAAYYFVDFNFERAARATIHVAQKLSGDKVSGLSLYRQLFSLAIDSGDYDLARDIAEQTGLLKHDSDREHIESILWREALLVEAEGNQWRALGMLRDVSEYPEPDVRARLAIAEASIGQRLGAGTERADRLLATIREFAAGTQVPRPQTLQRIQALLERHTARGSVKLSEAATEKLRVTATSFPIRSFMEVSTGGLRDVTGALRMNPAFMDVHTSARSGCEELALRELDELQRSLRKSLS